ncbi:MAG: hypothetical protein CMK09_18440 [Ponticaulis sp.]|nr:hypothetical protein [Ponticaulis sp.]
MFGKSKTHAHPSDATPSDVTHGHHPATSQTPEKKRPLLVRLFAVKFWGAVRLTLLCVLVGVIMQIGNVTTSPQQFDVLNAIKEIWENTFAGLIWLIRNGWLPALMGATVVLPIWVLWRLVSLPFRK